MGLVSREMRVWLRQGIDEAPRKLRMEAHTGGSTKEGERNSREGENS